jgi:hypothetical protein
MEPLQMTLEHWGEVIVAFLTFIGLKTDWKVQITVSRKK